MAGNYCASVLRHEQLPPVRGQEATGKRHSQSQRKEIPATAVQAAIERERTLQKSCVLLWRSKNIENDGHPTNIAHLGNAKDLSK